MNIHLAGSLFWLLAYVGMLTIGNRWGEISFWQSMMFVWAGMVFGSCADQFVKWWRS